MKKIENVQNPFDYEHRKVDVTLTNPAINTQKKVVGIIGDNRKKLIEAPKKKLLSPTLEQLEDSYRGLAEYNRKLFLKINF